MFTLNKIIMYLNNHVNLCLLQYIYTYINKVILFIMMFIRVSKYQLIRLPKTTNFFEELVVFW